MNGRGSHSWNGTLANLPSGGRLMLFAFVLIVACGYGVSLLNIYTAHEKADGRPGLSIDDIRAVFGRLTVAADAQTIPSKMLKMIEGEMRQYVGSDDDLAILEKWLRAGGAESGFTEGEGRRTPRRILIRDCLRCHAQSTGTEIAAEAPFGADEFDVDYAMLVPFLSPDDSEAGGTRQIGPQYSTARLILFSHYHMLSMPMFTLAIGVLFLCTRTPATLRATLAPIPMITLAVDFASWWLARGSDAFVYVISAAGAVYALAFAIQTLCVLVDLCRPPARSSTGSAAGS